MLGVLWALWHLPAYFNSTQVVADKVGLGELDRLLYLLPLLMLLATSTRIVMSWLFNVTMGSVIVVTLFHAAFNISNNDLVTAFIPEINSMFANNGWIYPVLGVVALLLILFTRGHLSYEPDQATPTQEAPSGKVERGISASNTSSG